MFGLGGQSLHLTFVVMPSLLMSQLVREGRLDNFSPSQMLQEQHTPKKK